MLTFRRELFDDIYNIEQRIYQVQFVTVPMPNCSLRWKY